MLKASCNKQCVDRVAAVELLELVNEFSDIFWQSKNVATFRTISPYLPSESVGSTALNNVTLSQWHSSVVGAFRQCHQQRWRRHVSSYRHGTKSGVMGNLVFCRASPADSLRLLLAVRVITTIEVQIAQLRIK